MYTALFEVEDDDHGKGGYSLKIVVADLIEVEASAADTTLNEGDLAHIDVAVPGAPPGQPYSVEIDWGTAHRSAAACCPSRAPTAWRA
ncbi:hypothetical protein [Ramlibacter montanisoli]|uniref:Uncharacterized protein n=1 Tax=Ramlibacter montanisoli TaxID=2732512 RepID=A0A849KPM6_9BURK|nr:hypothetical protein [Ramlibacter montanisoli]NNU43759.1 hypothetical protein [Ramlibacter montanisoli]